MAPEPSKRPWWFDLAVIAGSIIAAGIVVLLIDAFH